jgi:phthalate 4,5-cis-dihydrodiol dehydrogenase
VFHGGRWGAATLEVCLAMLESAKEREEIYLSHQVPSPE